MSTPSSDRAIAENILLRDELGELKIRLQEMHDTLDAIHRGDVDALVVNNDIYTLESAHAASNRLRQDVLGQMEDAVFAFDLEGHIIFLNRAAEQRYGVASADVLGRSSSTVFHETERSEPVGPAAGNGRRSVALVVHELADGTRFHVESVVSQLTDAAGLPIGTLAVIRDVSERRRAEIRREALVALSDRLRDSESTFDVEFESAVVLGRTLDVARVGYGLVDDVADTLSVARDWTAPGVQSLVGLLHLRHYGSFVDSLKRDQMVVIADVRVDPRTADGAPAIEALGVRSLVNVPVIERGRLVAMMFVNDSSVRRWLPEDLALIRDVAERTRTVSERIRSAAALRDSEARLRQANENLEETVAARTHELVEAEEALRQAQKMEAVGQLTGGIAHDFNNLLAGISTSLQVLQARLRQGRVDGLDRYIAMGQDSVKRAAALTQRLLAFARRQTLDPKPLDINQLVIGLEELVQRTVGPNVEVQVATAPDLWFIKTDASQVENSLLNLCINARDAMLPTGGRLRIETRNVSFEDGEAAERDAPAGAHVALSVTDSGTGMSTEVMKRVFDPFFTTKPMGQGTGLGLSMVYGFVRQSGGQVRITSELGRGTTMHLYFPRYIGAMSPDEETASSETLRVGAGEKVLVIEDEETLRILITEVLDEAGYVTLAAADGPSGLRLLQAEGPIDLLVTDVGLPGGMNGRQVADVARIGSPDLKVLFITGYAENAAVREGHLEQGMEVLTKPFEVTQLANKVRHMTERNPRD